MSELIRTKKRFVVQLRVYEVKPSQRSPHDIGSPDDPVELEGIAMYEIETQVDLLGTTVIGAGHMVNEQFKAMLKALEISAWPKLHEVVERWHRG